eukprot:865468-Alexandrium_andersonii.AAC.1
MQRARAEVRLRQTCRGQLPPREPRSHSKRPITLAEAQAERAEQGLSRRGRQRGTRRRDAAEAEPLTKGPRT